MDNIRLPRRQEGMITTQLAHAVGRLIRFAGCGCQRFRGERGVKAWNVHWGLGGGGGLSYVPCSFFPAFSIPGHLKAILFHEDVRQISIVEIPYSRNMA